MFIKAFYKLWSETQTSPCYGTGSNSWL